MIIVMNPRAGEEAIRRISTRLEEMGYRIHRSTGRTGPSWGLSASAGKKWPRPWRRCPRWRR